jgi:hypothetical protein
LPADQPHDFSTNSRSPRRCEHENVFLRNRSFAAREITDIALFDFSRLVTPAQIANEALVLTIAKALQVAGARLLNLDIREPR